MGRWAWWQAGLCLGAVSWLSIVLYRPISVSSGYPYLDALLFRVLWVQWGQVNPYLSKYQRLDFWLMGVLLGLVAAGAIPVNWVNGSREREKTEGIVTARFSSVLQIAVGGAVMLIGARMAGGCTCGHLIGGMSLLSVSGIVFGCGVFLGGVPVARWLSMRRG